MQSLSGLDHSSFGMNQTDADMKFSMCQQLNKPYDLNSKKKIQKKRTRKKEMKIVNKRLNQRFE